MIKKITVALAALMLLTVALPVNAQEVVEIRGAILDEDTDNLSLGFVWNATNFGGFWYDLDEGLTSENLTLMQADLTNEQRTIDDKDNSSVPGSDGGLVYNTTRRQIEYEVHENVAGDVLNSLDATGNKITNTTGGSHYGKLGWMAEEYVALNGNAKKLSKLLIEQEEATADKKTITVGETWDVGGGWELSAQSIDAKASPRQAWLTLSYNGVKLDDKIVGQGEVYTYVEKSIAGESDVPMFVTYVDSVFAGATTDLAQLRYTWAISRDITEIKSGDNIGVFELSASSTTVTGKLDSSIDLTTDSIADLAGDFKLKVADDSDTLRFMPIVQRTEPGSYEVRGQVLDENSDTLANGFVWDAQNFGGFWYDLDEGQTSENLTLMQDDLSNEQRTIDDKDNSSVPGSDGGLVYNTTRKQIEYEVHENVGGDVLNGLGPAGTKITNTTGGSHYGKLGWMAEEYVALNGNAKKLAKLLIEQEEATADKKTLTVGETWDIGGGWELSAQSIDAKASPRQAWLTLSYNGVKLDDKIVGQGEVYTYVEKSIAGESDAPMFVTYVDSVFAGATTDLAQLRYTWAISRDITEIKSGDNIGVFELSASGTTVTGKLDSSIDLTADSTVDLAGDFKMKVADDSDTLRFYPMVLRTIGEAEVTPDETTAPAETVEPAETTPAVNETVPAETTAPVETTVKPPVEEEEPTEEEETPTEPGFPAIFAITGLFAVAYLVLRQRK